MWLTRSFSLSYYYFFFSLKKNNGQDCQASRVDRLWRGDCDWSCGERGEGSKGGKMAEAKSWNKRHQEQWARRSELGSHSWGFARRMKMQLGIGIMYVFNRDGGGGRSWGRAGRAVTSSAKCGVDKSRLVPSITLVRLVPVSRATSARGDFGTKPWRRISTRFTYRTYLTYVPYRTSTSGMFLVLTLHCSIHYQCMYHCVLTTPHIIVCIDRFDLGIAYS